MVPLSRERADFLGAEAGFAQDLGRMLALSGRGARDRERVAGQSKRRRVLPDAVGAGDDHVARADLRIGERLVERQHRRDAALDVREPFAPVRLRLLRENRRQLLPHRCPGAPGRELSGDEVRDDRAPRTVRARICPPARPRQDADRPASHRRRSRARRRSGGPPRAPGRARASRSRAAQRCCAPATLPSSLCRRARPCRCATRRTARRECRSTRSLRRPAGRRPADSTAPAARRLRRSGRGHRRSPDS